LLRFAVLVAADASIGLLIEITFIATFSLRFCASDALPSPHLLLLGCETHSPSLAATLTGAVPVKSSAKPADW
jgi:hypothetical protein